MKFCHIQRWITWEPVILRYRVRGREAFRRLKRLPLLTRRQMDRFVEDNLKLSEYLRLSRWKTSELLRNMEYSLLSILWFIMYNVHCVNQDSVSVFSRWGSLGLKEGVTVLTTGKHFPKCCPVEKSSLDFRVMNSV